MIQTSIWITGDCKIIVQIGNSRTEFRDENELAEFANRILESCAIVAETKAKIIELHRPTTN